MNTRSLGDTVASGLYFAPCSNNVSEPTVASCGHLVSGDVIINDGVVFPVEKVEFPGVPVY